MEITKKLCVGFDKNGIICLSSTGKMKVWLMPLKRAAMLAEKYNQHLTYDDLNKGAQTIDKIVEYELNGNEKGILPF